MRVFTRPVSVVVPGGRSWSCLVSPQPFQPRLDSPVETSSPGPWLRTACPVLRVRRTSERPPGPSGFTPRRPLPCPFASPRNKEGSNTPSPRSGACSTGERRLLSRVLKRCRHADQRPDILSSDVSRSPSVRAHAVSAGPRGCWITFLSTARRFQLAPWRGAESFFCGLPGIGGVRAVFYTRCTTAAFGGMSAWDQFQPFTQDSVAAGIWANPAARSPRHERPEIAEGPWLRKLADARQRLTADTPNLQILQHANT